MTPRLVDDPAVLHNLWKPITPPGVVLVDNSGNVVASVAQGQLVWIRRVATTVMVIIALA